MRGVRYRLDPWSTVGSVWARVFGGPGRGAPMSSRLTATETMRICGRWMLCKFEESMGEFYNTVAQCPRVPPPLQPAWPQVRLSVCRDRFHSHSTGPARHDRGPSFCKLYLAK